MSDYDKAVFSKKELCIRNQELKRELGTFKSGNRTLQLRLSELKKENEQLKSECERAKTLRRIAYRNWDKVVEVIREEIKNTDNQEIKEFLVDLLNKELPDD